MSRIFAGKSRFKRIYEIGFGLSCANRKRNSFFCEQLSAAHIFVGHKIFADYISVQRIGDSRHYHSLMVRHMTAHYLPACGTIYGFAKAVLPVNARFFQLFQVGSRPNRNIFQHHSGRIRRNDAFIICRLQCKSAYAELSVSIISAIVKVVITAFAYAEHSLAGIDAHNCACTAAGVRDKGKFAVLEKQLRHQIFKRGSRPRNNHIAVCGDDIPP